MVEKRIDIIDSCMSVAYLLKQISFIKYLGRNTAVIFTLQFMAFDFIKLGLKIFSVQLPQQSILTGLIFSCGAILLLVPCNFIVTKYFPFILGRKKNIAYYSKQSTKTSL